MRLSATPLIVSLPFILFSSVSAREPIQYRIARRATTSTHDTCAKVDKPVSDIISMSMGSVSATVGGEMVQQCLCTNDASSAISSSGMSMDISMDDARKALTTYIASSETAQNCVYPPGAIAHCTLDDLCAFTCEEGYKLSAITQDGELGNTCKLQRSNAFATPTFDRAQASPSLRARALPSVGVRALPSVGVRALPSVGVRAVPAHRARAAPSPSAGFQQNAAKAAPTGSLFSAMAQEAQDAGCAAQEILCGAYAPRGRRSTECVNVQTSLESCGGCMSSFESAVADSMAPPAGVDCSAIEGVMDVGCKSGKCVVQSCDDGYVVASTGDSCVPASSGTTRLSNAISHVKPGQNQGVDMDMTLNVEDAAGGSGVNDVPSKMPQVANLSLGNTDDANVIPSATITNAVNMATGSVGLSNANISGGDSDDSDDEDSLDVSVVVPSATSVSLPATTLEADTDVNASGLTTTLSLSTPAVPTATVDVADSDSVSAVADTDSDA